MNHISEEIGEERGSSCENSEFLLFAIDVNNLVELTVIYLVFQYLRYIAKEI